MTLASIYITHHDGVRRRYELSLTPLLARLHKLVFGARTSTAVAVPAATSAAPQAAVSPRQLAKSRRKLFALAQSCEDVSPSLSAELRHIASR